MERPPSNFEHPVQLTKQMRQLQWQTAHLSAAHTRRYMPDCHLPRREQEDRAVFLLIFGDTVCDNITLTFRFCETLQERIVLRRLNGNKTNWYDIAQPSLNGRRVN